MSTPELALWQRAEAAAAAGQLGAARTAYEQLAGRPHWQVPAQLRLSMLAQEQGSLREAVQAIVRAAAGPQDEPALAAAVLAQAFALGEVEFGLRVARAPVLLQGGDAQALLDAAQSLCDQSLPEPALPLLEAAAGLGARSARLFHLLGVARSFAGDLSAAGHAFEQCLRLQPDDASVHYLLAGLNRQTEACQHVPRLRESLRRLGAGHRSAPLLHYALFKELDDLGQTEAAWDALSAGMQARRAQLAYDAVAEQALFDALHQVRPGPQDAHEQAEGPCPIFVVGLPRSGTTLLERLLGGHDRVADAGELRDFVFQARVRCDAPGLPEPDLALAQALQGDVDWPALGQAYLDHTRWRAAGRAFYTDKLPTNYLALGWIAKALPRAKFLHMVRDPVEVCFSNLKQLFAPGNAHSFDQLEMADHYARYRRLMRHWHTEFAGRILDVHYEDLVKLPEPTARRVLDFCGLDWQPGVVQVQARQGAVATASMVQVREGIHARYLGQWQRYAAQLQPLRDRLDAVLD